MRAARFCASVLRGACLYALPYRWLVRRLERELSLPQLPCYLVTSGRVALYLLASRVAATTPRRVALAPDYICNVVPIALERAGFTVEPYRTDERGDADPGQLSERVARADVAILLTASIFGSSALLDALAEPGFRAVLLRHDVHVIVDLCQDLSLRTRVPLTYGRNLSAVLSFNGKSLPGVMGGALLTTLGRPDGITALTRVQARTLAAMGKQALIRTLPFPRPRGRATALDAPFEFSYCRTFPYAFDATGISKLQVVAAHVGLANLDAFAAEKRRWLAECTDTLAVPHLTSAAYVVVKSPASAAGRRVKRPYALPGDPSASLRPNQVIVHNKGFCDSPGDAYD